MDKRDCFLISILCLAGIIAVASFLLFEAYKDKPSPLPTADLTDSQILELEYFDLIAVKAENSGLPSDIVSWSVGDGFIHLVLPGEFSEDRVIVYIRDQNGNLLARREYDFTGKVMIGSYEILLEHHNLPALYFESDDPSDYVSMNAGAPKSVICNGRIQLDAGACGRSFTASASLRGRGNTSWIMADCKKSYSLRFEKSFDLLGLGKSRAWNLIGNAFDPSLLKNVVFNDISKKAGILFQPNMQWVNLYVDGKYQGVYTLSSKIKDGNDRIPLGYGDYLYIMDPPVNEQPVTFQSDVWLEGYEGNHACELVYPEQASVEELSSARNILHKFVKAVEDHDPTALAEICDIDSLARYYWIQECSMNYDAWEHSVYMYYLKSDSKLHFGPVWDMDLTLGYPYDRDGMMFDSPNSWRVREDGWYRELFENSSFAQTVRNVYAGSIRDAAFSGLDDFSRKKEILGNDGYVNFLLFGYSNYGVTIDYGGDTYNEYCDNMISFYKQRIEWIDSQMSDDLR